MGNWVGIVVVFALVACGDDGGSKSESSPADMEASTSFAPTDAGSNATDTAAVSNVSTSGTSNAAAGADASTEPAGCTRDEDCGLCSVSAEGECCRCPFVASLSECASHTEQAACSEDCPAKECPMTGEPSCNEEGRCVPDYGPAPGTVVQRGSCQSDADCIVCEVVVQGTIDCCNPCGQVTSEDQCELNRTLAGGRCDEMTGLFACPQDQSCSSPLTPICVDGMCAESM
ncbi:MAG: hypothetical protein OEZ06_32740 [Myxococcales bacterium]|nr:hypothetical protein [Myxococcales bacterium]